MMENDNKPVRMALMDHRALIAEQARERNEAKKLELKKKTKKLPDGRHVYRIKSPYYSKGQYFEAGSLVAIPAEQLPSYTWEAVAKDVAADIPAEPAPAFPEEADTKAKLSAGKRASDKDV